jgi:hypothetical protein
MTALWNANHLLPGLARTSAGKGHPVYDGRVRRLFQLGALLMLAVAFAAPVVECFDRWDAPGIANDTEFSLFAFVALLCLTLIVCRLLKALTLQVRLIALPYSPQAAVQSRAMRGGSIPDFFIPPLSSPPLRI